MANSRFIVSLLNKKAQVERKKGLHFSMQALFAFVYGLFDFLPKPAQAEKTTRPRRKRRSRTAVRTEGYYPAGYVDWWSG